MCDRFSGSVATFALAFLAVTAAFGASMTKGSAEATAALRTPWGDPDLQGIWTDEFDTPFQRPPKYAGQEFFTEAQRDAINKQRTDLYSEERPAERGTDLDVARAYNHAVFLSNKRVGPRTSLIVDPPDGRVPRLTPQAQKMAGADREFRLALLQATDTCKDKSARCTGGKYDPARSPQFAELPPRYNTLRMNRYDRPEDGGLSERCLTGGLPEFGTAFGGSFRRIVQTPGGITMFYDVGQGQGWQRNIVMDGSSHLPPSIRQWFGDSRGHWEGDTLVIDATNFTPKADYRGSRENLHLVERWTRTGPTSLEYVVTVEDPTVWTRPWTVKQEFTRQSDQANRIYAEPRCIEGNYGLPGLLRGARLEDLAFTEGRGPDPATKDKATAFVGFPEEDPLLNDR
ncbi:MAG: hypothetical protein JO228_00200 [Xanthobacteraceae bacterium]|nr:hypothetical protein [Xanthobacteraceae bacterium]